MFNSYGCTFFEFLREESIILRTKPLYVVSSTYDMQALMMNTRVSHMLLSGALDRVYRPVYTWI
jgi:hypothetical protein